MGPIRPREFQVRAEDGRRLTAEVVGPEDGDLVLFHTGTPGCRLLFDRHLREGAERGLRHVIYSRPGYQGSDRQPGRSLADSAADSAAVVDALGVESFYSIGLSGGGGSAAACAALLPGRVRSAAVIAALGPREGEGLDWLAGVAEDSLVEFRCIEEGEAELKRYIEGSILKMQKIETGAHLIEAFGEYLCATDRRCLAGDYLSYQLEGCAEIARDGIEGWFDDDWSMWKDWGFDLSRITVPVTVWQGSEDRFVPRQNGEWLAAHIPRAKLRLLAGEGHLSLFCRHYGAVLDDLIAAAA
jgi:pimeloyl-ACP methyl ester carboxylesterase